MLLSQFNYLDMIVKGLRALLLEISGGGGLWDFMLDPRLQALPGGSLCPALVRQSGSEGSLHYT